MSTSSPSFSLSLVDSLFTLLKTPLSPTFTLKITNKMNIKILEFTLEIKHKLTQSSNVAQQKMFLAQLVYKVYKKYCNHKKTVDIFDEQPSVFVESFYCKSDEVLI